MKRSSTDDVIAAEVHRKALEHLTKEMAATLVRTSGSPIAVEAHDFSTCLMDLAPEHLAFGAFVLAHLGSSLVGTQVINELELGGDIRPGDGYVVNDPHTGGALHQGDVSVIMPTFYGDEHLGWSFVNLHVLDVGGMGVSGFSPGAHEVWQEGLLFPPIRVIRDYAIAPEWRRLISANVRLPGPVLNDIQSMIAANVTASRKLNTIIDEYGVDRHKRFCELNKDLSEALLRERISRLPDGEYESRFWAEFDGHGGDDLLLDMCLTMTVDGSDLRLAFTGVPQVDAFLNTTSGAMYGMAMSAIVTQLAYGDLPINGGIWRPIDIDLGEPGTIINATPPAPVSMGHAMTGGHGASLVRDVLNQALSLSDDPVLRGRVAGRATDGFVGTSLFGVNQYRQSSVMFYNDGGVGSGGPAQTTGDGLDLYGFTCMIDGGLSDVETHEMQDPVLFLWRRVAPNSGGAGQFRGGQALDQAMAMRYSDGYRGPAWNTVAQVPPAGVGGGLPAAAGYQYVVRDANHEQLMAEGRLATPERLRGTLTPGPSEVTDLVFARGDVLVSCGGGGSGLGDPLLRPALAVASDIADGYISPEHAAAVYGVVRGTDGELDDEGSAYLRAQLLIERIGDVPEREPRPPRSAGVAVVLGADGGWACGYCDAELAPPGAEWRSGGVVVRTHPIAERFATWGMAVRAREAAPAVLVREHFCPRCAGTLAIDVTTDAVGPLRAPQLGGVEQSLESDAATVATT